MATEISSDAQKVLEGATSEARDYVLQNAPGSKVTSGEAQSLLAKFGLNAQQVTSPANVQQAMATPAARPDLSDPFATREFYMNTADIQSAREGFQQAQQALLTARQTGRATQQQIEARPELAGVLTGRAREAEKVSRLQEISAAEQAQLAQAKLLSLEQIGREKFAIAQEERGRLLNIMAQAPGAKIKFTDNLQSAMAKAEDYVRKQSKKDAFDDLYFKTFGKDRGKLSRKEAEKKLNKEFKNSKALSNRLESIQLETAELQLAKLRKSMQQKPEVTIEDLFGDGGSVPEGTASTETDIDNLFNSLY